MKHRQFINSALLDNNVGKIELWGDVMESKPLDFWTGEPLDVQCITPQDFKEAMAKLQDCSTIELHLNSYGGDATVGIAIGNLLKQSGKHTVCIVEGIAASAAFTIAMSCDEVHVYPSSILMCHEVKSFMFGFYGNEELKKIENGNTAYNNASAEVYSRKSGMSKAQCLNLMKKETWMTGADAISYNFADKLLEAPSGSEEPVQLLNKTTMRINGVETDISGLKIPDEFIEHTKNKKQLGGISMAKENSNLKEQLLGAFSNAFDSIFKNKVEEEEEKEEKAKSSESEEEEAKDKEVEQNGEEEKEKQEQAVQEKVNSAVEAERKRIQEIQAISATIDPKMVQEAMFGETACDAKELALRAMKAEQGKAKEALEKMQSDNANSKANEVENKPGMDLPADEKAQREQAVKELQAALAKNNGGK